MSRQRKTAYSGGMSIGSRKRLARAVTIMSQGIRPRWLHNPVSGRTQFHRFSFITLTVSDSRNISHREAYDKLLNHFLDWMTRTVAKEEPQARTYIWKAELQKRGQIHYHITTPAFIHWRDIRRKWNQLQREAGLLDEYAKKNGTFDPNSTDVHDTRDVRKADCYMVKELCKSVSAIQLQAKVEVDEMLKAGEISPSMAEEKIKEIFAAKITTVGKIWGCSQDLAGVNYYTIPVTIAHEKMIRQWVYEGKARMKVDDYFSVVYCDNVDPPDLLTKAENKGFVDYLRRVFDRTGVP